MTTIRSYILIELSEIQRLTVFCGIHAIAGFMTYIKWLKRTIAFWWRNHNHTNYVDPSGSYSFFFFLYIFICSGILTFIIDSSYIVLCYFCFIYSLFLLEYIFRTFYFFAVLINPSCLLVVSPTDGIFICWNIGDILWVLSWRSCLSKRLVLQRSTSPPRECNAVYGLYYKFVVVSIFILDC